MPQVADRESQRSLDLSVKKLQEVALGSAIEVASVAWMRAYWRSHPHRLVDFVTARVPAVVAGPGVDGEHRVVVVHAIRRSALDGVLPAALEGEVVPAVIEGEKVGG
jgi:hypothetical protein